MAKPARAGTKPQPVKHSLQDVYHGLEGLLKKYVPPLKVGSLTVRDKQSLQLVTPKPVTVPGAYGGKPVDWQFAAAILQKNYVGFYLMGAHSNPELRSKISLPLLKTLKGKSCFHLKSFDEQMKKDIATALDTSLKLYKERGWV